MIGDDEYFVFSCNCSTVSRPKASARERWWITLAPQQSPITFAPKLSAYIPNSAVSYLLEFWASRASGKVLPEGSFAVLPRSGRLNREVCSLLAILALNPPLLVIYPFYLASSLFHIIAAVRRNASWIAILSGWLMFAACTQQQKGALKIRAIDSSKYII